MPHSARLNSWATEKYCIGEGARGGGGGGVVVTGVPHPWYGMVWTQHDHPRRLPAKNVVGWVGVDSHSRLLHTVLHTVLRGKELDDCASLEIDTMVLDGLDGGPTALSPFRKPTANSLSIRNHLIVSCGFQLSGSCSPGRLTCEGYNLMFKSSNPR
jgi:hypothetical protein